MKKYLSGSLEKIHDCLSKPFVEEDFDYWKSKKRLRKACDQISNGDKVSYSDKIMTDALEYSSDFVDELNTEIKYNEGSNELSSIDTKAGSILGAAQDLGVNGLYFLYLRNFVDEPMKALPAVCVASVAAYLAGIGETIAASEFMKGRREKKTEEMKNQLDVLPILVEKYQYGEIQ